MPDADALLQKFHEGDRLALSRLLSLVARNEQIPQILAGLSQPDKSAVIVALTGSAGVGKSTLIGQLLTPIRNEGKKVAVLACDPQSPLSGGALLGDRFRMSSEPDEGLFIRSLSALSGHGAIADHLSPMIRLLEAFGFDVVLIETVGAGQGDTAVANLAHVVVLLLQPETGDDLQWEKAGVLEVADIIAVQKSDLPGAEQVAAQVKSALELSEVPPLPVLLVSAKTGKGITELWQAIASVGRPVGGRHHSHQFPNVDSQEAAFDLLERTLKTLEERFASNLENPTSPLPDLVKQWKHEQVSTEEAKNRLLKMLMCSE